MKARKRRRKYRAGVGCRPVARWSLARLLSLSFASLLLILLLNSSCLKLETGDAPSSAFAQVASSAAQTTQQATSNLAGKLTVDSPRPPPASSQQQQQEGKKRTRVKVAQNNRNRTANKNSNNNNNNNSLWQPTEKLLRQQQPSDARDAASQTSGQQELAPMSQDGLQVSITPRVSMVRVPAESNAILKCLISAQTNNFTRPFKIKWSRKIDSMYEQIESSSALDDDYPRPKPGQTVQRGRRDDEPATVSSQPDGPLVVPNRLEELRDFLARSRQETNVISNILIEATLSINSVKSSDNASYYCTASDGSSSWPEEHNKARIDLLVLSRPSVRLDRVQPARDSKSALVHWTIVSEGNTPIKKTILMVRNDSQAAFDSPRARHQHTSPSEQRQQDEERASIVLDSEGQQWHRIDIQGDGGDQEQAQQQQQQQQATGTNNYRQLQMGEPDVDVTSIGASRGGSSLDFSSWPATSVESSRPDEWRQRTFNLSSLLPGVTYQLRLAATNDMGQSDWSQLAATMPNEIPAQINDIQVLSATNDSITIGWRRSAYDGAKTIRYEMQLFDLNRTLTLDANTNTNSSGQMRTNFMFHFVNLNPGTDYHFHIRACSRAGCSAYSSPKLLASTLDGEPDEPLDVELVCQMAGGGSGGASTSNLSVSWLPPVNVRGRLLNYSVTIESIARYQNQSGQWTSDEWRTRMDTGDNHTLGLEAGNLLMPNTNYTVRVCANNRSRKCGKASQLTARARCTTPSELPRELPAHIGLALKQTKLNDAAAQDQLTETLVLEMPFVSSRNGSIDCLQVVLVRLPKTFGDSQRALSDFLPDDPAEIRTHAWLEAVNETTSGDSINRAVAYLADELDQATQRAGDEETTSGIKQIVLGDGLQSSCNSLHKLEARHSTKSNAPIQALDGPLIAQTYYTGFLKLIQIKTTNKREDEATMSTRARRQGGGGGESGPVELLAKYSNYFSPVRTGDNVPQVSIDSLLSSGNTYREDDDSQRQISNGSQSGICASKLVQQVQDRLGVSQAPCVMVAKFAESARKSLVRLYRSASSSLSRFLDREQRQASPMQPLEIGLFVFVASLLLLSVIYLFTLPSRLKRKRRVKMKKQLMQHEQAAAAAAAAQQANGESAGFQQQAQQQFVNGQLLTSGKQRADLQALTASLGYQQVAPEHVQVHHSPADHARQHVSTLRRPQQECPVHSSPMSAHVDAAGHNGGDGHYGRTPQQGAYIPENEDDDSGDNEDEEGRNRQQQFMSNHRDRRQSVHVCQQDNPAHRHDHRHNHHHGHAHYHDSQQQHVHHKSAYQLDQFGGGEFDGRAHERVCQPAHMMDYERNCRTMTRQRRPLTNGTDSGGFNEPGPIPVHYKQQQVVYGDDTDRTSSRYQTMTSGQAQSVLALAKKINKPVPLGLFRSVHECRLKNGWLRDEYEQLPRSAQQLTHQSTSPRLNPDHEHDGRHLKLRPQLIVSRDDAISALISGNDHYDGSLIKLPLQVAGGERADLASVAIEKQFICAKSPIDPDSVWDFWRLIYEREVSTLVMLTAHVDIHTGDVRCAQYWPTCDNEETTILSPCNEFVQQSDILPAKFKVRQETLNASDIDGSSEFVVRRLTLLVMATKPSENEHTNQAHDTATNEDNTSRQAPAGVSDDDAGDRASEVKSREQQPTAGGDDLPQLPPPPLSENAGESERNQDKEEEEEEGDDEDEERLIIVERNLLHFQFLHWNASSPGNQTKLLRFVELVNARHARSIQMQASPGADWQHISPQSPILIHCANGLGRSGLFAATSSVIDDLHHKLTARVGLTLQQYQMDARLNLFQLVARMRAQRDMLLSPYRFYELLYQLTSQCIEAQLRLGQEHEDKANQLHHRHHLHTHRTRASCTSNSNNNNSHNGGIPR